MSAISSAKKRFAVVGLGDRGLFHLEQLTVHANVSVELAVDASLDRCHLASGQLIATDTKLTANLLNDLKIDIVWLAVPGSQLESLLKTTQHAGCRIVIDFDFDWDESTIDMILSTQAAAKSDITIWYSGAWHPDFNRLEQLVKRQSLGTLKMAERTIWQMDVVPSAITHSPHDGAAPLSRLLTRQSAVFLYQALRLIGGQVNRLWCRHSDERNGAETQSELSVLLEGPTGQTIWLNIATGAPAVLDTGWRVCGTTGSVVDRTVYQRSESGELIDIPLNDYVAQYSSSMNPQSADATGFQLGAPQEPANFINELLRHWDFKSPTPGPLEPAFHLLEIWQTILNTNGKGFSDLPSARC